MSLAHYRKMRDFSRTAEPSGKARPARGHSYVIQKHDASHLHYDFRLELEGVLLSWAVPKGPSLDPKVKRLAMQTEDHPIEYGGFEGIIPEGEYGGGTVMVWDRGTWEAEGDARAAYRAGNLKFVLHGQKLTGGWHLVRTARGDEKKRAWLLFKSTDEAARPGDTSLLEEHGESALSGRSLVEIAEGKRGKAVWHSNKQSAPAKSANVATAKPAARTAKPAARTAKTAAHRAVTAKHRVKDDAHETSASKRARMPVNVEAELATLVTAPPAGDEFVHEVKFDGYRVLVRINSGEVELITRGGEDWTARMPALAEAAAKLKVESAIIDGEFVALNVDGTSDFQLLQNSFSGKAAAPLAYYAFDLLYLNGQDVRELDFRAFRGFFWVGFAGRRGPPRFCARRGFFRPFQDDRLCRLVVAQALERWMTQ